MTGQILLTIIMVLCFIIPLVLHYSRIIDLFDDEELSSILPCTLFILSVIYLIVSLFILIITNWNKLIF